MERIKTRYVIVGLLIALGLFFEIAANADDFDQATIVTFGSPVEVPGQALPAGTYLFRLADNGADLNVVQIFNSDGTKLYATLQAIPTDLQQPTNGASFTLAEQGAGAPDALLKWFYPGSLTGHEFLYSARKQKQLDHNTQETMVIGHNVAKSDSQAGE